MYEELIQAAIEARGRAYTPYSGFRVGAAVETEDGTVFTGSNIEIASYSPTNCAERTAIFSAVHAGARKIVRLCVVGTEDFTYPCGVCRQVMREFGPDMEVIIATESGAYRVTTLEELLPHSFGPEDLEGESHV